MAKHIKEINDLAEQFDIKFICHKGISCANADEFCNCRLTACSRNIQTIDYDKLDGVRAETAKEFAEELLNKINNGLWSEDDIYRQGQQAMAFWVTKYIADLVEQFGKED